MIRAVRDISGFRFGKLTVLTRHGRKPVRWLCACDCGVQKLVTGSDLRGGNVKSCGCGQHDPELYKGPKKKTPVPELEALGLSPGHRAVDQYSYDTWKGVLR